MRPSSSEVTGHPEDSSLEGRGEKLKYAARFFRPEFPNIGPPEAEVFEGDSPCCEKCQPSKARAWPGAEPKEIKLLVSKETGRDTDGTCSALPWKNA